MKKNILIFIGSYLPGTKSAGVTTSISNMVKYLHEDFNFYILTADRDIGDSEPYSSITSDKWVDYDDNCKVFYSSKYKKSIKVLKQIINNIDFDYYYFNGFYNVVDIGRVLPLYFLKLIPQKKIIIAPRGIFSMGEYKNKQLFRYIYRKLFIVSKLDRKVIWHATSTAEKSDIEILFKNAKNRIANIPNLSNVFVIDSDDDFKRKKIKGELNIVFLSRISEKKNIKYILNTINNLDGKINLNIYGMIGTEEDNFYWKECEQIISRMKKNIVVNYYGEVAASEVSKIFRQNHIFYFPTFGENYGHVIAESLLNACPVLLSDKTPWNNITEYEGGWIFSLEEENKFVTILENLVNMNEDEWMKYSKGALIAAKNLIKNDIVIEQYREFFNTLEGRD